MDRSYYEPSQAKGSVPGHRMRIPDPIPQVVCPSSDSPLSWYHNLGWRLMGERLWANAAPHNPILYYLTGKGWSARLEDLAGVSPWLVLLAVEGLVAVYAATQTNLFIWFLFLLCELLVLPLGAGIWTQIMVFVHYGRVKARMPTEELALTRLTPQEIVTGLALRPIMVQVTLSQICTLIPLLAFIVAQVTYFSRFSLFSGFDLFLILAGLTYRLYVLKHCVEFAGLLAMRCTVFYARAGRGFIRSVRDWVFPWALIPLFFVLAVTGAIVIQKFTVIFFYLAAIVPLVGLWLMIQWPSLMRTYAEEANYWLLRGFNEWAIRTGQDSPMAPGLFLSRWRLDERLQDRRGKISDPKSWIDRPRF